MRKIIMTGWFGFWIFMTIYMVCEFYLYNKGNDTLFWRYKTPEEKILQMKIINGEVK